ncbi:MAG: ATP-binding cassette domain-containing protein, partial [Actinomycetota bacterium]
CGLYAGVAGGLWAYLVERVAASPFSVWNSLGYIAAAVVGGLGSWTGAVVAAVLFFGLPELLPSGVATYSPLAGAILLALVPVLWPEGLGRILNLPLLGRQRRLGRPRQPEAVAAIEGPAVSRAPAAIGNGEAERRLGQATRSVALSVPVRTLLVSRDIQVAFGGLEVLKGVNLEVRRGELVGLIGPNGAGKTTFFNCVSGFVRPRGGEITYRGRDLLSLPAHVRPGLGIIRTFQQVGLCPPQTVWENALLAQYTLGAYGVLPGLVRTPGVVRVEREVARRAEAALEVVGISELANERVGTLPHGQQRLVEVAVALAAGPELLLLDEPAAGMGPEESNELGRRLADLHSRLGLTILIIEHHVPMVANLCTYIYVLNDGRVLAEGNPEQVQRDPGVVATYLGEEAAPEAVKAGV